MIILSLIVASTALAVNSVKRLPAPVPILPIQSAIAPGVGLHAGLSAKSDAGMKSEARTFMILDVANKGKISIELHTKSAPKTCQHIEGLVRSHFYDHQKVFRVIKSPQPYLVQLGDPESRNKPADDPELGQKGSGVTVPFEESNFQQVRGAVCLAVKNNNRDSGDSQFYILLGDYANLLDGTCTVFGKVTSEMDVVDHLAVGDVIESATIEVN